MNWSHTINDITSTRVCLSLVQMDLTLLTKSHFQTQHPQHTPCFWLRKQHDQVNKRHHPPPSHPPKKTGDVPFSFTPFIPIPQLFIYHSNPSPVTGLQRNAPEPGDAVLVKFSNHLLLLYQKGFQWLWSISLVFRAIDFVCQTVKPSQRLKARFCNSSDLTRVSFLLRAHSRAHKCV